MLKSEIAELLGEGNAVSIRGWMTKPKSYLLAVLEWRTNPTEDNKKILAAEQEAWSRKQLQRDRAKGTIRR